MEQQLSQIASHFRARLAKIKQQYEVNVALQKQHWQKQKAEHDANRIKKLLPTSWNTVPMGTPLTETVVSKYREGTIPHVVAMCVADIVDAVEIKLTNPQVQDERFEDFKPPPPPDVTTLVVDQNTGETMSQQIQRAQRGFQQELQAVTVKLSAAEEERKRTWKRMLKIKAEVEQANSGGSQFGSSRQNQMPSYTPGRRDHARGLEVLAPPGGNVNISDSKYSAARVKERIRNDGSVEPISKSVGADGKYLRPPGRGRKGTNLQSSTSGCSLSALLCSTSLIFVLPFRPNSTLQGCDWDCERGVWVPQPE